MINGSILLDNDLQREKITQEKNNIHGKEESQVQGENVDIGQLNRPDLKKYSRRKKTDKAIEQSIPCQDSSSNSPSELPLPGGICPLLQR